MDKTQPHPLFKLATELGPLLVFFFVNAKFNLFAATGAFMVAIVAAMIAAADTNNDGQIDLKEFMELMSN